MGTFAAFSDRISKNLAARYAVALLATVTALLARWALGPFLGEAVPYITLFPAVAFSAWYCGLGPTICSIVLGLFGAKYLFIAPIHSLGGLDSAHVAGIVVFLFVSAVVVAMGEASHRKNKSLRSAQSILEERVKERTAELDAANQDLRELTARLLQLQDDERRRIARELHDSVGQTLAVLAMNLSAVGADIERLVKTASVVKDSTALISEISRDIRTISHLLHPPLLDEAGLLSALRWYAQGFAERSKIKVDLEFPDELGRLPRESETAIFRVVQECLTNIHRHSESPVAKIRITRSAADIWVEVEDRGKGIPSEKQPEMVAPGTPGVGVRGMRERLAQLGGSLEINSDGKGTVVVARLPVASASPTTAASKAAGTAG